MTGPKPSVRLRSVVLDCPEPADLASFYAALTGGRLVADDPTWCEVHLDGASTKIAFQKADDYSLPEWPDGSPQQLHLDLTVEDMEGASSFAVSLGAQVLTGLVEEPDSVFMVHVDPAGHPFCLCMDRP